MDFKKFDQHTPHYYYSQFKQAFESDDPKTVSAALFGLLYAFSQDYATLTEGPFATQSRGYVKDVVDYLDRKYTATIRYFHQRGIAQMVPPEGYKASLLGSRPDIAELYGAESGLIV